MNNQKFYNFDYTSIYGMLYFWGSGTETLQFSNFVFENITKVPFVFQATNYASLSVDTFHLEKDMNLQSSIFQLISGGNVEMNNMFIGNYSNAGNGISPAIDITSGPASSILIQNLYMNTVELLNVPFLRVNTLASMVTVQDVALSNVEFAEEESLFSLQTANSFLFQNFSITSTTSVSSIDSDSVLISIPVLDVGALSTGMIQDFTIQNSSVSMFKVNNLQNLTTDLRSISLQDITYSDSVIPTSRALISTDMISADSNLDIYFNRLNFHNIEFPNTGTLLDIKHHLPNTVTLSNSTFDNISDGSIYSHGSQTTGDQGTKFKVEGCSFTNIQAPTNPFMTIEQRAMVEVVDSSFMNFTLTTFVSGIMNVIDSAQVTVSGSNFTQNSAMVASLTKVESEAIAQFANCKIHDNFAITNGVFEVASSGIIDISDSEIFNNFAIQYPVGTVFLSVDPSNITNTEIYQNRGIQRSEIATEASSQCVNLCFIQQEMKDHLLTVDLSTTTEDEHIFQVLQGSLNIMGSSHIHHEGLIFTCFLATINIDNSKFSDISYSHPSLNILDSKFTIQNTEISGAQTVGTQESFIIVNSGVVTVQNVSYSNSNSELLIALSTTTDLLDLNFHNVSQ